VVDATGDAQDEHVCAVRRVLEELELAEIPRLVVFNKIDAAEPLHLRALRRQYPEAEFVSATCRETTRPLIERLARELAAKWDASAKGPSVQPQLTILHET
jgi:GTP-binding protein HflX